MKEKKKKIIITGAAGEVGLNLARIIKQRELHKRHDFIFIDKNNNNLEVLKAICPWADTLCTDLSRKGEWSKIFRNTDVVIQLQAQISSPEKKNYYDNNVRSVKNVVNVSKKYKVKHLIHASSSVVISVAKDNYTETKRLGEEIVRNGKVPYTMLRPTLMYGCFDIKHTGYLVSLVEHFPIFPMPGSGNYIRQPLYVDDFCNVILRCVDMGPENGTYNITGKEEITVEQMLRAFFRARKMKRVILHVPLWIFYVMIRMYMLINWRTRIVPDQLTALIAGDMFPVIEWDKIFKVRYTKFNDGVRRAVSLEYYRLSRKMTR